MNDQEFRTLKAQCAKAMETYFAEAEKTSRMFGNCTPDPLPFEQRFALLTQEIIEKNAGLRYLQTKRLLHNAALLGYETLSMN